MEIDDTPMKLAIGELMAYAARSESFFREIEDALAKSSEDDMLRFRLGHPGALGTKRVIVEPGDAIAALLDSFRKRNTVQEKSGTGKAGRCR